VASHHLRNVISAAGDLRGPVLQNRRCSRFVHASLSDASQGRLGGLPRRLRWVCCTNPFCGCTFLSERHRHGTEQVSEYLKAHLHGLLETVQPEDARPTIDKYRGLGGNFFRRFKGGILDKIASGDESEIARFGFALDQRATLAFLQADQTICHDPQIDRSGATATVALMHSLDVPPMPFFASSLLAITIAHVGDTSALLCTTADGSVLRLTEDHHPDSRNESNRLQRVGIGLVTDSFGEVRPRTSFTSALRRAQSRLGGALANSRAIGDVS
jgi:protein phosphatase PTC6